MFRKNQLQIAICLIAIIIIASFLRLYNLMPADNSGAFSPPGLYPDEAMNGNNAVEALEAGDWKVFYPENFGREGLFINIQSALIGLIGLISPIGSMSPNQPWILRLPSALFGILTVLGLYFLTKELFMNHELGIMNQENQQTPRNSLFTIRDSEKIALLSTFLLATSFWHIMFSRIGFRAIMAPAFLVWALYFLLLSCRLDRPYKSYPAYFMAAIGGMLYGFGMHSYIAYRATPLLILFIFYSFYKKQHSDILKNAGMLFLIFTAAAALAAAPLAIYFYENPQDFLGRTAGISIFTSETPLSDLGFNAVKTLGMFNIAGDFNWRHNFAGRPLLFWPVGLLFLAGLWNGLVGAARMVEGFRKSSVYDDTGRDTANAILIFWMLFAALPVVISNEGLPHALRSVLMIPPVFILAAVGGLKFYETLRLKLNGRLLSALVFLFLGLLLFESYAAYFIAWTNHPAVKESFAYRDYVLAERINSLSKETAKYVAVPDADRTIERDYPVSLQSVLFLTDTFSAEKRAEKNVFYLTPAEAENLKIPEGGVLLSL